MSAIPKMITFSSKVRKGSGVAERWVIFVVFFFLLIGCGKEADREQATPEAVPEGLYLSEQAERNIGLETQEADFVTVQEVIEITGVVRPLLGGRAFASSRAVGVVKRVYVKLGDRADKGQKLAEIESPESQKLQVELMQAHSNLRLQESTYKRITALRQKGIASEKEAFQAENALKKAQSQVRGLRKRLTILGLTPEEIEGVEEGDLFPTVAVISPISGTIVEVDLTLGETVEPLKKLFSVVDLRALVIEGDLSEHDIARAKEGQKVRARLAAFPDTVLEGEVLYVGDAVHREKRSVLVRAKVYEKDHKLRPEMFAQLALVVGEREEVLAVPRQAVIGDAAEKFVFVKDGDRYLKQNVGIGMEDDRYVVIVDGLYPGDLVVTHGNIELWTESLKPQLKTHHALW